MITRVLGIDPGTAVTGYGVIERSNKQHSRLVECGVIRTNSKHQMSERLETIYDGVSELIVHHDPSVVAVETAFYKRNVNTTILLGQARGMVLLAAVKAGKEIAEFSPAFVKKSVSGKGAATKKQVAYMVQRLLRLKDAPQPSDAADACAIALTYVIAGKVAL